MKTRNVLGGVEQTRRALHALFTLLLACDAGTSTGTDGAVDVVDGDRADAEAGSVGCTTACCCFDNNVPCDWISYTYPVTFAVCPDDAGMDAALDGSCYPASDCQSLNSLACENADIDAGDPYPCGSMGPCGIECYGLSIDGGVATATCSRINICGRRLEGLTRCEPTARNACGRLFAEMAWLEAASIRAFNRLARELVIHRAPRHLVRAARRSAREEARHRRMMSRLALKYGASPPPVKVKRVEPRSLEAIARENAVEGCVGETWGALLALRQAARATDPDVRSALADIATDEARHAALAWEVAAWAEARLEAAARVRIRAARDEAMAALLTECEAEPNAEIADIAGLPSASEATRLAKGLFGELRAFSNSGLS